MADHVLQLLLLVLKEVLIDGVPRRGDLVSKHDLPKHVKGKDVGVAQDAPRMHQHLLRLHACRE